MGENTSGYEFRIGLSQDTVTCRYDTPEQDNLPVDNGTINREPHLETIVLLEQWLKRWEWIASLDKHDGRLLVPDTFKVLGNHLWNLAFNTGAPGQKLLEVHKSVARMDPDVAPTIRVRISFGDQASDLAALPWEFVHYPGGALDRDFFLAAETSLVLGRYLDGMQQRPGGFRPADSRLRVLFVLGLPRGEQYDDERAGFSALISELHGAPAAVNLAPFDRAVARSPVEIKSVDGWDPKQVRDRLAEFQTGDKPGPVDVVHLFAMCSISGGRQPLLYLPEGTGDRFTWTNPESVVEVLTYDRTNRPELVVLHLCDSREHEPEHFEQLAPAFVRAGIPAVLAMQYPMQPASGQDFVKRFYLKLAEGEYLGQAVQSARHEMLMFSRGRYFGTPVLYMQNQIDGNLIERRVTAEETNDRRPSAVTGLRRVAPNPGPGRGGSAGDLRSLLLREVDGARAGAEVSQRIESWIEGETWPPSVTRPADMDAALATLRLGRRLLSDDAEADQLMRRLIGFVAVLDDREKLG
jgi:hypothetical protein